MKLTIGQILLCTLLSIFLIGGVYSGWYTTKIYWQLKDIQTTEIFRLPIDLTKAGSYAVSFTKPHVTMGSGLWIEIRPGFNHRGKMRSLIEGLEGNISIKNVSGEEVFAQQFSSEDIGFHARHGSYHPFFFIFYPRTEGEHELSFIVEKTAGGLTGKKQELYQFRLINALSIGSPADRLDDIRIENSLMPGINRGVTECIIISINSVGPIMAS